MAASFATNVAMNALTPHLRVGPLAKNRAAKVNRQNYAGSSGLPSVLPGYESIYYNNINDYFDDRKQMETTGTNVYIDRRHSDTERIADTDRRDSDRNHSRSRRPQRQIIKVDTKRPTDARREHDQQRHHHQKHRDPRVQLVRVEDHYHEYHGHNHKSSHGKKDKALTRREPNESVWYPSSDSRHSKGRDNEGYEKKKHRHAIHLRDPSLPRSHGPLTPPSSPSAGYPSSSPGYPSPSASYPTASTPSTSRSCSTPKNLNNLIPYPYASYPIPYGASAPLPPPPGHDYFNPVHPAYVGWPAAEEGRRGRYLTEYAREGRKSNADSDSSDSSTSSRGHITISYRLERDDEGGVDSSKYPTEYSSDVSNHYWRVPRNVKPRDHSSDSYERVRRPTGY